MLSVKILYLTGLVFSLMLLLFNLYPKLPRFPWDINIDKPNLRIYIPVISALAVSVFAAIFIFGFFK